MGLKINGRTIPPIQKRNIGERGVTTAKRDVRIKVNKSGTDDDGGIRYAIKFYFYDEAYKKVTTGEYVAVYPYEEEKRIYFTSADKTDGYKLSGKTKNSKVLSVTCHDKEKWDKIAGDYNLLKDRENNVYYIDLPTLRTRGDI